MTDGPWPQVIIAASTLGASFGGYFLAGLNEARRDRRSSEQNRAARAEERRTVAMRDRHQLQLETLLALQDAVQLAARLAGRTMHFDHMQARKGQISLLPADDDKELLANGFDVIRLRNRLLDEGLRTSIEQFEAACAVATAPPVQFQGLGAAELEQVADRLMVGFHDSYTQVMSDLGRAVRAELDWLPSD